MEKLICKVPKESEMNENYVLLLEWCQENVILTVIDNDKAWAGQMASVQMSTLCKAVHKTKEEYLKELRHAFSENEREFTFVIDGDQFIVKKVDLKSNIKIKFCIIHLKELPVIPTYFSLLSQLLDQERENISKMSKLTQEVQYLEVEREDFKRKLLQFANEKASLETLFYSKFCEILNAKKDKIACLESQIGAGGDSTPLHHPPESFHHSITSEQKRKKGIAIEKCKNLDYPSTKRKCTEKNLEVSENSRDNTVPSTSEINEANSNLYDSETDVDTDDESGGNDTTSLRNVKTVSSSLDALEETPPKILPKREHSSFSSRILPKREEKNISVMDKTNRETDKLNNKDSLISEPDNELEEFNSQSLLDDY